MSKEFEIFTAHMLLCAPTPLNRAWAASDGTQDDVERRVGEVLKDLHFSPEVKDEIIGFAVNFAVMRNVFKGVADVGKDALYSGSEPHPTTAQANRVIDALKALA